MNDWNGVVGKGCTERCVCVCVCQLPALSTQQQYSAAVVSPLVDNMQQGGWIQSDDAPPRDFVPHRLARAPLATDTQRTNAFIPATPPPRSAQRPPAAAAAIGSLTNEMRYPEAHSVPHGGPTRASLRRPRHGSIGERDRDWYSRAHPAVTDTAASSLRRPRPPPGDCSRKHELLPPTDWTAACELEYRV